MLLGPSVHTPVTIFLSLLVAMSALSSTASKPASGKRRAAAALHWNETHDLSVAKHNWRTGGAVNVPQQLSHGFAKPHADSSRLSARADRYVHVAVQTDPTSDYPKPRKKQVVSLKRNTWSPSPTAHVGSDGWLTVHWLPPFGRVESESMVRFYSLMWRFGDQGDWCGTFQSMSLQQPSASFDLRDNTKLFEVSFRYAYVLHDDRASSWSMVSPAVTVCARCP